MPHEELLRLRQQFMQAEGDNPLEREEVTDAQLSALHAKVTQNLAPYVDMGVWGPFGERIARTMKFTAQVLKDGQWKAVELPGAANWPTWEEAWGTFRTAAIMLRIATAATLDRYAMEFKMRIQEHPDAWRLAAQADIRCRSEWWMQERRRQEAFHAAHRTLSSFAPLQPWNSVITQSAQASDFWAREFEKPALLYKVNGPQPMPAYTVPEAWKAPPAAKHEARRRDGRYFKSKGGVNICYDWARHPDECNNEKCERDMAHVCEWCRQPHKTINCPQVPGWRDEASKKGKGRGKGKKGKVRKHL